MAPRFAGMPDRPEAPEPRMSLMKTVSVYGLEMQLYMDVQNVFNAGTITDVNERYPDVSIGGYSQPIAFGDPTEIAQPRRMLLGARWSF